MAKLTIALDVDDTVMPFILLLCQRMKEKHRFVMSEKDCTNWDFTNFPEDVRGKIYGIMKTGEVQDLQYPWISAVKMISELLADGHRVMFASAVSGPIMTKRVLQLNQYFPEITDIMLGNRKDLLECDFLLDDSADNILRSHAKHPVLLRKPWNQHITQEMADMMGFSIVETHEEFLALVRQEEQKPQKEIVCLLGPSGSGKTAIAEMLTQDDLYSYVQSATTRPRREGEREDAYLFLDKETFVRMQEEGKFLETSSYKGNLYGTPLQAVDDVLAQKKKAVMVMDINGPKSLRKTYGDKVVVATVFRKQKDIVDAISLRNISEEEKARRIQGVRDELMLDMESCDVVISNTATLERAANDIRRIMR